MSTQPLAASSSSSETPSVETPLASLNSAAPDFSAEMASYRLAAIVESADDAIISKTLDGIITSWNQGAQRIFGYTADEVIGRHISVLIPPDHLNEEPQILARLRRGEKIEHYETVRARKDGQLLDISLTVSPIRAVDGTIVGASKIARNITEQKAAQLRLQQALADAEAARKEAEEAKKAAENANRLKDQFLSTISHELRTPMTSVMGWVAMLRSGRLDEAMALKGLETIDRNVKAQTQLIEDLLDISRIVSGKMRVDPKPLNLASVIHAAVDTIMPAVEAKGLRMQVLIDPGTGSVIGDYDRLQQIIWNLLANAVKFTPHGGRIRIEMERAGSQVEVTVSDNGIGIEPNFLPHIFDRFSQEDSSSTRAYGGLGMGLSIVKYIVELHGGTIRAASEGSGKGTALTLALPLAPKKPPVPLEHSFESKRSTELAIDSPAELDGLKILVVDDELDTCEMVRAAFEQCGSIVEIATSAPQALTLMNQSRPDVLICDISMPQMDGYQLIQQLREIQPQDEARVPAIALTALARVEDRAKALTAGYQMHVPKPVQLQELYAVVASLASVTVQSTAHSSSPKISS